MQKLRTSSPILDVTVSVCGDRALIGLVGELDQTSRHQVDEALDALARAGTHHFRIDASGLTFTGSAGAHSISVLLDNYPASLVTLMGASPIYRRMLEFDGTDTRLTLVA